MEDKSWSFGDILQSFDVFDFPISLTHKKKSQFKTSIGGVLSLFIYFIMSFSIFSIIKRMVNREDVNIIETTSQNEYFSNKEQVYPFENKKFMLGVGISAISTPGSCSHQSTKFTLHQNLKVVNEENITENSDEQITPIE